MTSFNLHVNGGQVFYKKVEVKDQPFIEAAQLFTKERGNNMWDIQWIVLTTLFFIWAFVTNLNDILAPYLKRACNLNDFQSSIVQFAFLSHIF